jgi:predicted Ser/Thr protein kinase
MKFLKALNLADGILTFGPDSKAIFAKAKLDPSVESMCKLASGYDFTTVLVEGLGLPRAVRPIVGSPDMAVYEPLMRAARGETQADPIEMLANLEISNFRYQDSDTGAVGIAVVKETEPFKFDLSEVYGEENLKALMQTEADPEEMVKLIGAYPVANRGVMEWVEMAKAAIQAIRSVLEATQDRRSRYPAPFGTRTLLQDMLIIAHTNTPEYVKLITTPGNEPFEDRFTRHDVLQPVRPDAIRKTLLKQSGRTDFALSGVPTEVKIEPTAIEICADFLAASRLELPKDMKLPLLKVVDIIGGAHYEPKETGTRNNVVEIMDDLGDLQGRKGKTLRWLDKIMGEMAGRALLNGRHFLSSREVIDCMDRALTNERKFRGEDPSQDKTTKPTTELGVLQVFLRDELKRRRARRLARMVRVALQIYLKNQGQGQDVQIDLRTAYSSRYLSVAQSLQEDASSVTAEDKAFVNAIEAEMGVASSSRETMRNMALGMRSAFTRRAREAGQIGPEDQADLPLEAFEPLKKAIDRKIAKDIPPSTAISMLRADANQRQGGLDTMSRLFGLTPEMAEEIAREVEEQNYLNELGDGDD